MSLTRDIVPTSACIECNGPDFAGEAGCGDWHVVTRREDRRSSMPAGRGIDAGEATGTS